MALTLRELQLLAEESFSVEDTRKDLNRLVDYFLQMPEQQTWVDIAFVKERDLPMLIAKQQKVFFVDEDMPLAGIPEEFHHDSFGFVRNRHLVYAGRLVYPVMDVRGNVMGFCGWDKFEKPKYLDSTNYGYKAKQTTVYGMEMLPVYYRSNKPVYVVEGITCCLYLRSIGLQAIALLGSSISPYVVQILRRFGRRLVIIPDNDAFNKSIEELAETELAGEHLVHQAKRKVPKATVIQSRVAKDIDDTRKLNEHKFEDALCRELLLVAKCPFGDFKTIRVR